MAYLVPTAEAVNFLLVNPLLLCQASFKSSGMLPAAAKLFRDVAFDL